VFLNPKKGIIEVNKGLVHSAKVQKEQAVILQGGISIFPGLSQHLPEPNSLLVLHYQVSPSGCRVHSLPAQELQAGFGRTDCGSPQPSVGDAQVLNGVCAFFEQDSHASIHIRQGILLALSHSEGGHKFPLWRQKPLGLSDISEQRIWFLLLGASNYLEAL
jgi:hypothetical protein